jgi:hypothetical protein
MRQCLQQIEHIEMQYVRIINHPLLDNLRVAFLDELHSIAHLLRAQISISQVG